MGITQAIRAATVAVVGLVLIQPTAASGIEPSIAGTVERVVVEAPGFGQSHPDEHRSNHTDGPSSEEVYLVSDDGRVIRIPDALAADLQTGQRATARTSASQPRVAASVQVLADPQDANVHSRSTTPQKMPYALVAVRTPDTVGTPATLSEVSRWLLDATQSFFEREAAGAFEFSVHSTHTVDLGSSICRNESASVSELRTRLSIPRNVGVILIGKNNTCGYGGLAVLGSAQPGQWLVINYESPASKEAWSQEFYENQGREIVIHEIGHNLGLSHSGRWLCASGTSPDDPGSQDCGFIEYGSGSSVMGSGPEGGALDAHQRWQLGVFGPGRMLSAAAGSGQAILLEDRLRYTGPDDGTRLTYQDLPVVRALHLRDSAGEVWLVARSPLIVGWSSISSLPPGVVAVLRTGDRGPIQADVVRDPEGNRVTAEEYFAGQHDIIRPGSVFTTPGGTRVNVGAAVSTPYGTGFIVEWVGPPTSPPDLGPPEVYVYYDETYTGETAWLPAGPGEVVLPENRDELESCDIIDEGANPVASWRTGTLMPVPGPAWWQAWDAWSPELQREARADFRTPLVARDEENDYSTKVELRPGTSTWRMQCRDFQGRVTTSSESTTVRADGAAPTVREGSVEIVGLVRQRAPRYALSIIPEVAVRVPAFTDDQSGLDTDGRTGDCSAVPADEVGLCTLEVYRTRKGRVSTGAEDRVGNASPPLKATYSVAFVNPVQRSSAQWAVYREEAKPRRKGASTTVSVRGRSAAIYTWCGAGAGVLEASLEGRKPLRANLARSGRAICTPFVIPLPKGRTQLTLTFRELRGSDRLFSIVVLR